MQYILVNWQVYPCDFIKFDLFVSLWESDRNIDCANITTQRNCYEKETMKFVSETCWRDFAISTSNVLVGQRRLFIPMVSLWKKKARRKNKGLQTKINHGNWAIFALSIAFLSISVRVDRCTFISMFSRSYTHALYISKCSTINTS